MYPEDRVLVGVINRKRDLDHVRHDHWYRIPAGHAVRGIHAEYLAFYLSRAFGDQNGAIHYYARRTGHELVRRRDLLPDEAAHRRADDWYYKIQLGELRDRNPPIQNPARRAVVFIYTTWDRFSVAEQIADLYSTADSFVDRVFYALSDMGIPAERYWEAEHASDDGGAQLRIPCHEGDIVATTAPALADRLQLPVASDGVISPTSVEQVVADIRVRVRTMGGLLRAPIP